MVSEKRNLISINQTLTEKRVFSFVRLPCWF